MSSYFNLVLNFHSELEKLKFIWNTLFNVLESSLYLILIFCSFPGKNPTDDYLEGMMGEAPGPINFTMFLTLFGDRLQGTDPEDVIKNAFGCFDEDNSGIINEERLRELLTSMGDRFTDEDVSIWFHDFDG